MRVVWSPTHEMYFVVDEHSNSLFSSKNLIDCEDYMLGRNMRSIYAPD